MDPAEAFSALGLAAPVTADAIRRAYLRGVRAHSPERDPEGFRRIREAYELLKDAPWVWKSESESDPNTDSDPEPDSDPKPVVPSPLPRVPRATEDPPETPKDAEPFDSLEPEPTEVLDELIAKREFQQAAELLLEGLTDRGVGVPASFNAWQVRETVLGLFERSEFELGGQVLTEFDQWVGRRGTLPSAFGSALVAEFVLLNEINVLHGSVEDSLLKALAVAVRRRDFSRMTIPIVRARERQRKLERVFKTSAPSLYAAAWPKVGQGGELPRGMKRSPFLNFGFGLLFLLVIRMVRSKDSNHAPEGPRYTGFSERAQEAERSPPVEAPFVAVNEVDESIRVGDCGRLRILWPLYVASRPNDGDVQAFEWARSQRLTAALTICPELDGELQ